MVTKENQDIPLWWTLQQEYTLVEASCGTLKNNTKGNGSLKHAFWEAMFVKFHDLLKNNSYCNTNTLSSKLR